MTQYHITIKDTKYDVEILDDPRQEEVLVKVNGEEIKVIAEEVNKVNTRTVAAIKAPVTAKTSAPAASPASAAVSAGPGTVKSPLPGVVNAIKVHVGQKVKPNDELCVVEAMKAMNVIRSQQEGTVARIHVSVGAHIAHGAPLLDIE